MHLFRYQGPKGTSPGHVIWVPSHNMAAKLILDMQKLFYGYGYVHISAYNCNKMMRIDLRCIFLGTRGQMELVLVMLHGCHYCSPQLLTLHLPQPLHCMPNSSPPTQNDPLPYHVGGGEM